MHARYEIILVVMLLLTIMYLALVVALTNVLKVRHRETWQSIGSYTLFTNNTASGSLKFIKYFVFSNSFLKLDDIQVTVMGFVLKVLFFVCMSLLAFQSYSVLSGQA
jgi:hypothetical protein